MNRAIIELLRLIQEVKEDQNIGEETLIDKLRHYGHLHAELFGATRSVLFLRDPIENQVAVEELEGGRVKSKLASRSQLRRYLESTFDLESNLETLEGEIRTLLGEPAIKGSAAAQNSSLDLFPINKEVLAEVVPIQREVRDLRQSRRLEIWEPLKAA